MLLENCRPFTVLVVVFFVCVVIVDSYSGTVHIASLGMQLRVKVNS